MQGDREEFHSIQLAQFPQTWWHQDCTSSWQIGLPKCLLKTWSLLPRDLQSSALMKLIWRDWTSVLISRLTAASSYMPGMRRYMGPKTSLTIKANDTDILVSILPLLHSLGLDQLWLAFGQGQSLCCISLTRLVWQLEPGEDQWHDLLSTNLQAVT